MGKGFRRKALGISSSLLAAVMMCGMTVNASEIVAPDTEIALETEETTLKGDAHLREQGETIEGRDFGGGRVVVYESGITLENCTGIAELIVLDTAESFGMYGGSIEGGAENAVQIHGSNARINGTDIHTGVVLYESGAKLTDCTGITRVTVVSGADNFEMKGCDINGPVVIEQSNATLIDCTGITQLTVGKGADSFTMRQCTIDGSNAENSVLIQGNNATLHENVINAGQIGLYILESSGHEITWNTIQGAKGYAGFLLSSTGNNTVSDNTVSGSGHSGLIIDKDTGSTFEYNRITDSVTRPVEDLPQGRQHGEGVIIVSCNGTTFNSNHILDTHSQAADNGNGIIVSRSENVTVAYNQVARSGNHGIQVSYQSKNITVDNNSIADSGHMGISVSRGAESANLSSNTITGSGGHGVTFDGHETDYGACTGSLTGNIISGSKGNGVQITQATVSMSFNTIEDNAGYGISLSAGNLEATSNSISLSKLRTTGDVFGIALYNGSTANLIDNHIGNYGGSGVYANAAGGDRNRLTGSSNTVTVEGTASTLNNAYWDENPGQTFNNQLLVDSFGVSGVSGQNYRDNVEAGAVVAGTIYPAGAISGGKFSVSFPEQPNTDNIVMYVKDANGNAICINAAPGFDLNAPGAVVPPTGEVEPPSEEAMQKIGEFVTRMYNLALGRTPDQAGFENWVTKLAAHEVTGAEAAYGFVFGPELSGKNLSNEQFVAILYELMLDREADAAGLADWTSKLDNNLYSRQGVYRGFAESQEFTNICAEYSIERGMGLSPVENPEPRDMNFGVTEFVSRLYLIALNRAELDTDGLNDWCGQLVYKTSTPAQIVFGVIFSDECQNRKLSNEEFVDTLYRTYFDRERNVEEGEGNDWLSNLNAGASRESIVDGFSGSQEFFNLVASFGL